MKNLKIFEKLRYITSQNLKLIGQSHLDARFATPERALKYPATALGISNFEKLLKIKPEKSHITKTTKKFEQPQLEERSFAMGVL